MTWERLARLLLAVAAVACMVWAGSSSSFAGGLARGLVGLVLLWLACAWALIAQARSIMRGERW